MAPVTTRSGPKVRNKKIGLTRQDLVFLQCSKTPKWSNLLP